jgi:Zn-dependent protease with chaperone function
MKVSPAADWNASDAERNAPRLGVATRLRVLLSSPRSALHGLDVDVSARDPRATNLLEGLVGRAGIARPELRVYRGPPNALVVPGRRPVFAISSTALDELSRTELEAVLAHCVVRVGIRRTAPVGYEDDVRAAALTRYPPGLAKALEKLVAEAGSGAHWFTAADTPSHRPVGDRIAALEEL